MTLADIAVRYFAGHMTISLARSELDRSRLKQLQLLTSLASMTWYYVGVLGCTVGLAASLSQARPPDASRQAQLQRNPPEAPSSGGFRLRASDPRTLRAGRRGRYMS